MEPAATVLDGKRASAIGGDSGGSLTDCCLSSCGYKRCPGLEYYYYYYHTLLTLGVHFTAGGVLTALLDLMLM